MRARARDDGRAIELFNRVETKTRDPWVIYLARYFKGRRSNASRNRPRPSARIAARWPPCPARTSASMELAALLFRTIAARRPRTIVESMFAAQPRPADPWRGYADADDRFWPLLIARLRAEIRR